MYKRNDEIDWEDFKKLLKFLNGISKPVPAKHLNTCNKKSKKKGFAFGQ